MRITEDHLARWHEQGYVVVENFLTAEELAAAQANLARYLPSAEEHAASPQRYQNLETYIEFPFADDALNNIATHPEIISAVERLTETDEIVMNQCVVWAKYAGREDHQQDLHSDWRGNSLCYPRDDGVFTQIPIILFYTDVTEDLGPMHVVSQEQAQDEFLGIDPLSREERPDLYELERPILAPAGSLMIWSMRTLHRGSRLNAQVGCRVAQFLGYAAANNHWMGYQSWPRDSHTKAELQRFVGQASPRQREVIGFPSPGHAYWNEETIRGTAARYPGFDAAPYLEALSTAANA
jgi:ectoine hydroxylase-related dioxygenase (phytanoyl-CoA dioxygenase family)